MPKHFYADLSAGIGAHFLPLAAAPAIKMKLESSEFDLVVEAGRTERHDRMDLWRYRELFCFLAWRLFYDLNSMAGVIDRFRWAIPGPEAALFLPGFYVSMGVILPQAATGVWYFRRTEKAFGDIN